MCRQSCFPPGFPREEALEILLEMETGNTDGTGSVYIQDGKFIVNKWAKPLSKVLARNSFLSHMPYDGWTVAHLRAASQGAICQQNTHPFVVGKWAVTHNGHWSESEIGRLALESTVEFKGETDSEVAAHLINLAGPKRFAEAVDFGGVFFALNKNGHLWAIKTSGQLDFVEREGQFILSSEFNPCKYEVLDTEYGWYHFGKDGCLIKNKVIKNTFCTNNITGITNYVPSSSFNRVATGYPYFHPYD